MRSVSGLFGCTRWLKDTKLKVNHSKVDLSLWMHYAVLDGSKILN